MTKTRVFSRFLAITIMAVFLSQARASFAKDDVKMFNFYQIKYKANDRFDIFVQPDTRFRDDIGEIYYYHFRNGIVFHAFKNLDLGATYRFARNKNSSGNWLNEHRLELDIAPKVKIADFSLLNRVRFEYRGLRKSRDRWRYRNLSKITGNAKIGDFEFIPYISEEIFYDFEIDKMHLNWATIGVDKKINKNLLVGIFYRNEASRVGTKDQWDTNHVIGTKVVFSY
jgi:hypothetical protein